MIARQPAGLSGAPPGPRQPDLRRAALTSAAAELFTSRGVEATTIDDIAARARLSKGSFYHYFRNKADILAAVRTRFAVEFRDRVAATVERRGNASWAEKLGLWVEGMIAAYFELHPLHDVLFHGGADANTRARHDGGAHRELVSEYLTVRHLIELLRSGMSAGAWHVQDPRAAAVVMFCGLHGAIDEALIAGTGREEITKTITPLFRQMVGVR
jgi:AcrR family transcriptional regulator